MKHKGMVDLGLVAKLLIVLILTMLGIKDYSDYLNWKHTHNQTQVMCSRVKNIEGQLK